MRVCVCDLCVRLRVSVRAFVHFCMYIKGMYGSLFLRMCVFCWFVCYVSLAFRMLIHLYFRMLPSASMSVYVYF